MYFDRNNNLPWRFVHGFFFSEGLFCEGVARANSKTDVFWWGLRHLGLGGRKRQGKKPSIKTQIGKEGPSHIHKWFFLFKHLESMIN